MPPTLDQIDHGSGTTPTFLGDEWVAIADNTEPRLNVLGYRRGILRDKDLLGDGQLLQIRRVLDEGIGAAEDALAEGRPRQLTRAQVERKGGAGAPPAPATPGGARRPTSRSGSKRAD
jgi:hypothetical protein